MYSSLQLDFIDFCGIFGYDYADFDSRMLRYWLLSRAPTVIYKTLKSYYCAIGDLKRSILDGTERTSKSSVISMLCGLTVSL